MQQVKHQTPSERDCSTPDISSVDGGSIRGNEAWAIEDPWHSEFEFVVIRCIHLLVAALYLLHAMLKDSVFAFQLHEFAGDLSITRLWY